MPYLYTIASRLCVDESRRVSLYSLEDEVGLDEESREIRQVENREELSHLLEKLPPELKEVIFLRFGGELSYLEIARITGSNMRTVQSRIRKALKIMRQER